MAVLEEYKSNYGQLDILIDGEWLKSKSTNILKSYNPATGLEIGTFPRVTDEEARAAVVAAHEGFKKWKNICVRDRAKLLFDFRAKLEENFEELCRILTQDHGRTISESRGSVRRVIENIESACSGAYGLVKMNDHIYDLAKGIDQKLFWEPLGAFLIVTPGNIPMHAWSSFVPYALATGCSVVINPSSHDPIASQAITRLAQEVFPPGVINLVYGGRDINKYIMRQPEIKGLGFIGSTLAGRDLNRLCGELGKPCSLNGNGKNHVVIMPDADLKKASKLLMSSCFAMGGQRCLGSDNVVVVGGRLAELKENLIDVVNSVKLGYGLDESVDLGPMCTQGGKDKVVDWIGRSLADGAKMVVDGRAPKVEGFEGGYYLSPTILEGGHPNMVTATEESFGPVSMLMESDDMDQALEWINGSCYGHSACIFTESGVNARKFIREAEVGNVGVNLAIPQPYAFFPLGSKKDSFLGSDKSRLASMKLFLDEKTVTERWV